MTEALTRRGLRHALIRRRNARIAGFRLDDSWPLVLRMSSETRSAVLVDGDPAEQGTVDFEGRLFMGIPILVDEALGFGDVAVDWPPSPRAVEGVEGVEVSGG